MWLKFFLKPLKLFPAGHQKECRSMVLLPLAAGFHLSWMKDGFRPRIDHIYFWCGSRRRDAFRNDFPIPLTLQIRARISQGIVDLEENYQLCFLQVLKYLKTVMPYWSVQLLDLIIKATRGNFEFCQFWSPCAQSLWFSTFKTRKYTVKSSII